MRTPCNELKNTIFEMKDEIYDLRDKLVSNNSYEVNNSAMKEILEDFNKTKEKNITNSIRRMR